jgi:predicted ATP-grasp superfamily ATP-dependent carboligase
MATVLITDGMERAALAACRSLVAGGHRVHVVAARRWSLAGATRGVGAHRLPQDALRDPEAFATAVGALARRIDAHVLLPVTDASTLAVLANRDVLPGSCVVPIAGHESFRRASDKAGLLAIAGQAGFGVPETVTLADFGSAEHIGLDGLEPGVIKPHRSVFQTGRGLRKLAVQPYRHLHEARRILQALPPEAFPVLLQRQIVGPGVGFFALRWSGAIKAVFAHERLREVPPWGGVSVYRAAIELDPALAAAGTQLLDTLGWEGVAMIECKRDAATGRYYIIEINPRFWGSLQLAVDAGVDFPMLLVACALGQAVPPVTAYRTGLRCRWEWGEIDHIYLRAKFRPPGASAVGTVLRSLGQAMIHRPGRDRCEVLRWRDPAPFLAETLRRLGGLGV